MLDLAVDDNGRGLGDAAPDLSGLARHRARAEARGGSLALEPGDEGARLHLVLPFDLQE
ncbi:hypothetical protein [Microbacterium halophytorum]|uniref:hypothetical protein n=1 Tax=Microbacterium halophytorum TaxID=2067568 RepID=UPI001319D174|nr:hypothetical protein [Microbacterium halophytorum]